nr:hypothetical protein [Tanacetum cinerariifolium]
MVVVFEEREINGKYMMPADMDRFKMKLDYRFYALSDLENLCEILKDILVVGVTEPSGEKVINAVKWFVHTFVHSFSTKSSKNAVSLYLEHARLIDRIHVSLQSSSSDLLVTILNDSALDSFVVTNSLKSAPSPDSALSLIEALKKIPHFTHNQNTRYALANILVKLGDTRKLKALVNGINSGKFKNVACTGKDYEAVKNSSRMIDEGGIPNSRTCTVIIKHLLRYGNLDPAMDVFTMLLPMGVKHTIRQYSVLVDALCGSDRFDMVNSLLTDMQIDGIFPNQGMLSSIQRMHDAGFVEETSKLIKEID